MNIAVKPEAATDVDEAYAHAARRAQSGQASSASRTTPSGRCSSGCGARIRCTSPPTASSAPTGRSPAGTTSWRSTPTTRPSRRPRALAWPTCKAMEEQEAALKAMGREPRRRGGAGFITMDEPEHSVHRKAVSPTVAPANIAKMAPVVRERAGQILDSPADRQAVRLGRPGLEGTDGDDAGHAVRLPVRGAPQAALLVGHGDEPAGPRAGEELGAQGRGHVWSASATFESMWNERVDGRRRHRPDLDADARTRRPGRCRASSTTAR